MSALDVNARWQGEKAEFLTGIDGRPPDQSFLLLDEVFYLEDQVTDTTHVPTHVPIQNA